MTNEPSPRPWRVKQSPIGSNAWVVSGETFVASVSRTSDAALIVDAVNEHDRLRDLVKRMADKLEAHRGIFTGAGVYSQTAQEETSKLLREARAALMEQIVADQADLTARGIADHLLEPGVMWGDTAIREDEP